jgi:hypothetical protein
MKNQVESEASAIMQNNWTQNAIQTAKKTVIPTKTTIFLKGCNTGSIIFLAELEILMNRCP